MTLTVRSIVLGTALALAAPLAGATAVSAATTPQQSVAAAAVAHRDTAGQDPTTLNGHGLYKVRLANTADGRIKVSWKLKKSRSKGFKKWKIVTSTSRKLGTDTKVYHVKAKKRSVIVKHAASVTPASGDYTFVKVFSIPKHGKKHGSSTHWIQAPITATPSGSGSVVIGTFNVRDAAISSDTGARAWSNRKQHVIDTINGSGAAVVNLQEASGMNASGNALSQALDLQTGPWRLANTNYYPGGTGSQGTRILYNSNVVSLVQGSEHSAPVAGNRFIEWAKFTDRTGHSFWDISMHLLSGKAASAERTRAQEAQQIAATARQLHADGSAVFLGGDSNSTIYSKPKGLVHRALIGAGFYDSFATRSITNQAYPTTNDFSFPVKASPHRRDLILSYGAPLGSYWYKNLYYNDTAQLASDHYMQVAQLPLR